jgi:hypothetical protein
MAARRAIARRLVAMELFALADSLGVAEGRVADAALHATPAPAAPGSTLRAPLPADAATLERTAALLEHSAALRQRLAEVLDGGDAESGAQ